MTELPSFKPRRLPEGRYKFTIAKEPEKRRHNAGTEREFVAVTFFFRVNGDSRTHQESIVPWDDKYRDLLLAIGGEEDEKGEVHLSDMVDIVGKSFEADIVHEPDKDDPQKSWARIANIKVTDSERDPLFDDDVPPPNGEPGDEEIPF